MTGTTFVVVIEGNTHEGFTLFSYTTICFRRKTNLQSASHVVLVRCKIYL